MSVGALLLCGGLGERLNAGTEKALTSLAGRPLFAWSLETLERTPSIEGIVVVGPESKLRDALAASGFAPRKVVAWGAGGRDRQDSVARGLALLPPQFTHVAVHDAARALVSVDVIARAVALALQHGAALAAIPLDDTLKRTSLEVVADTVPRAGLYRAQTPQVFRRDWFEAAHAAAQGRATDDAALVEALGHPVRISPGDPLNFKITTPQDLALAEAWLTAHPARVAQ